MKNMLMKRFALVFLCASHCFAAEEHPNIVFILADDMGFSSIQANNPEFKVPTPSLDRLISEGINFTDAHSGSSVCTPTRYGLLTGVIAGVPLQNFPSCGIGIHP